jgi:hypothetical protein
MREKHPNHGNLRVERKDPYFNRPPSEEIECMGDRRYGGAPRAGAEGQSGRAKESFAGRGPRGYQRKDERILEDVCERLTEHSDIDASEIQVEVENGEVTLSGSVEDRWTKRAAEDTAYDVSGVREVHNRLRMRAANAEKRE